MSDDTKEDKDEEKEEEKKDDDDASLACAELLRLALLSKDLNTLNTTNQTRLSDGEVKQLSLIHI